MFFSGNTEADCPADHDKTILTYHLIHTGIN